MFRHCLRLTHLVLGSLALLPLTSSIGWTSTDTYVIDSEVSRLSYIGSNAFPGPCPIQCDFHVSGSFDGTLGVNLLTISNASLSLDGDAASDMDTSAVEAQFPRTAQLFRPGFLDLDTNVLALLSQFGDAIAVRLPEEMRLTSGKLRPGLDGPSYAFDITVYATNQLDCNGDGEITFDDVMCLEQPNLTRTVLDVTDTIPGDTDGNHLVDFGDFLNLSNHFGGPGNYTQGDLDLDGAVGFTDFLTLSKNFGESSGAEPHFSTVPEPSASGLLAACCVAVLGVRSTRRGQPASR